MVELRRALPEGDHARLDADGLELRAVELVRAPRQFLKVDPCVGHFAGVDLEDPGACGFVG